MNIHYITQKIKGYFQNEYILIGIIIISIGILSFLLGKYSVEESALKNKDIFIVEGDSYINTKDIVFENKSDSIDKIYASKNGTKYYLESCGTSNIKEENKIWFSSTEEALTNGYTLASSCQ